MDPPNLTVVKFCGVKREFKIACEEGHVPSGVVALEESSSNSRRYFTWWLHKTYLFYSEMDHSALNHARPSRSLAGATRMGLPEDFECMVEDKLVVKVLEGESDHPNVFLVNCSSGQMAFFVNKQCTSTQRLWAKKRGARPRQVIKCVEIWAASHNPCLVLGTDFGACALVWVSAHDLGIKSRVIGGGNISAGDEDSLVKGALSGLGSFFGLSERKAQIEEEEDVEERKSAFPSLHELVARSYELEALPSSTAVKSVCLLTEGTLQVVALQANGVVHKWTCGVEDDLDAGLDINQDWSFDPLKIGIGRSNLEAVCMLKVLSPFLGKQEFLLVVRDADTLLAHRVLLSSAVARPLALRGESAGLDCPKSQSFALQILVSGDQVFAVWAGAPDLTNVTVAASSLDWGEHRDKAWSTTGSGFQLALVGCCAYEKGGVLVSDLESMVLASLLGDSPSPSPVPQTTEFNVMKPASLGSQGSRKSSISRPRAVENEDKTKLVDRETTVRRFRSAFRNFLNSNSRIIKDDTLASQSSWENLGYAACLVATEILDKDPTQRWGETNNEDGEKELDFAPQLISRGLATKAGLFGADKGLLKFLRETDIAERLGEEALNRLTLLGDLLEACRALCKLQASGPFQAGSAFPAENELAEQLLNRDLLVPAVRHVLLRRDGLDSLDSLTQVLRENGVSLLDQFYSKVTLVDDLLPALQLVLQDRLRRKHEIRTEHVWLVNAVFCAFLGCNSSRREVPVWTKAPHLEQVFQKQIEWTTGSYGLASANQQISVFPASPRALQSCASFSDQLALLGRVFLHNLEENTEKSSADEMEVHKERSILPLIKFAAQVNDSPEKLGGTSLTQAIESAELARQLAERFVHFETLVLYAELSANWKQHTGLPHIMDHDLHIELLQKYCDMASGGCFELDHNGALKCEAKPGLVLGADPNENDLIGFFSTNQNDRFQLDDQGYLQHLRTTKFLRVEKSQSGDRASLCLVRKQQLASKCDLDSQAKTLRLVDTDLFVVAQAKGDFLVVPRITRWRLFPDFVFKWYLENEQPAVLTRVLENRTQEVSFRAFLQEVKKPQTTALTDVHWVHCVENRSYREAAAVVESKESLQHSLEDSLTHKSLHKMLLYTAHLHGHGLEAELEEVDRGLDLLALQTTLLAQLKVLGVNLPKASPVDLFQAGLGVLQGDLSNLPAETPASVMKSLAGIFQHFDDTDSKLALKLWKVCLGLDRDRAFWESLSSNLALSRAETTRMRETVFCQIVADFEDLQSVRQVLPALARDLGWNQGILLKALEESFL